MDKKIIKFLIIISLILMTLTSLPYLYGLIIKPTETIYLGNGLFNPHDNHVYYAYIEQVKSGRWLLTDVFTSETQKPFFHIFWLIVGWGAKILSLSPILAFHLARIILIPLFVFTVFKFLNQAWANDEQKIFKTKLALIILFFTSGIGGWKILTKSADLYPTEVWWPEAYAFFSAYASPHFIASWILILGSLYFYLLGIQTKNYKKIILGGFLGALLVQFHTFYLALLIPLTIIFLILKYKKENNYIFWYTALYNFFFIPVILYYFFLIKTDTVMAKRLTDSIMLTPQPTLLLAFVFGFLFFLALYGLAVFFQKKQQPPFPFFLMIWFLITPLLLYSGLPFERRLVEGWQLPTVFFATEALYLIYQKIKDQYLFIGGLIILFFFNNLLIFILTFTLFNQTVESRQLYLPQSINQSLLWLKNADPSYQKIVLASPLTSLTATFIANKTIFLGHLFETINSKIKKDLWLEFIGNNNNDQSHQKFLQDWKIDYLIWGPYEKLTQPQFQPAEKNYLKQIFQNNQVIIYQVKKDALN